MTSSDIGVSSKYKTVYSMGTSDSFQNNYNANSGIKGDAIYETSSYYNGAPISWNSDLSYFPCSDRPFFSRGGPSDRVDSYYNYAGLFSFNYQKGSSNKDYSFRVCLAF